MSVVSVLHAPRDEALGRKIADALSRHGHAPRRMSGEALQSDHVLADNAAIVIWSCAAAEFNRLREIARDALQRGSLIPVAVGHISAPEEFDAVAPVDLAGWAGDDEDPRWRFVLEEIDIAGQRGALEDGAIWTDPVHAEGATPADVDDPSLDIPALNTPDEIYEAQEDFNAAPMRETTLVQRQFSPLAVALVGGVALFGAAGVAMVAAPSIFSSEETPPTLAYVQPVENIDQAILAEAVIEQPAPTLSLDTEDMRLKPPTSVGVDTIEVAVPQTEAVAATEDVFDEQEQAIAEEGVENGEEVVETSTSDDTSAQLLASIERGIAELEPQEGLAENLDEVGAEQETLTLDEPEPVAVVEPPAAAQGAFKDCEACPSMASIAPGRFWMGTPASEAARAPAEGPLTEVNFSAGYAIAATEVTFAQWEACLTEGGCRGYRPWDHGWGREDRPVIGVSYEDAKAYVAWLSQKTGHAYRLPSEAEWEYAARAGTPGAFAFAVSAETANFDAGHPYRGEPQEARNQTTPAGSFAPNTFGLFDMHGNVWEWTEDCWAEGHDGASANGAARGGACAARVLKGGAWNTGGWRLRSGHRIGKGQTAREFDNGFRVVRDLN